MQKNLKTAFILFIVMSAVIIAFSTVSTFFGGTGIGFAGLITLLAVIVVLGITDSLVGKRIKDLLILASVFTILEFIIYFFVDYVSNWNINIAMFGIQNVVSFLGIFFLAYIIFRFICEIKNVKLGFIECLLGNGEKKPKQPKQKKAKKELENGSLEDKPTKIEPEVDNIDIQSVITEEE